MVIHVALRAFVSSWLVLAAVAFARLELSGQVRYATGQNVVPVFEGWHKLPDGSYDMVFGYMNRNYEEHLDLPVGADNLLEPGLPDQGQPTHFYPRRQQFVFKVRVPADWGKKDLVWTLRVNGRTEKAYASLLPHSELGDFVYQENRGSTANITDTPEPNEAPKISLVGSSPMTLTAGAVATLSMRVTDDGHPVPRRPAAAAAPPTVRRDSDGAVITATGTPGPGATGVRRENPLTQAIVRNDPGVALGVTWIVYRGNAAKVRFGPQRAAVVDGKADTKVAFEAPGVYTIRAYADDGILVTPVDVVITVRAAP
jgi:hypothetical protein